MQSIYAQHSSLTETVVINCGNTENRVGKVEKAGDHDIVHYKKFLLFGQFFKRLVLQTHKNKGLYGKGLKKKRWCFR